MASSRFRASIVAMAAVAATPSSQALAGARCGLSGGLPPRTAAIAYAIQGQHDLALRAAGSDSFLVGYVSYLTRDYARALVALTASAREAAALRKPRDRQEGLARAGYWASRTLEAQGRMDEALTMRQATVVQKGSFYALLVDVQSALPGSAYPSPGMLYTDPRASKAMVWAITREESNFQATASSGAGAHGAMQMLDGTARRVAGWVGATPDMNRVHTDFNYNVALGSTYLGWLLERYGDYPPLAAAGYNAGEGCADAWIKALGDPRNQVDPLAWIEAIPIFETRQYTQRVMATYIVYMSQGSAQAAR